MALTLKVPKKNAQDVQQYLLITNRLDRSLRLDKDDIFLYFPVKERFDSEYEFVERDLEEKPQEPTSLKEELSKILTEKELERVKTAYDTVGDIAIMEIDDFLAHKKVLIAETLLKLNKNIATVLRKEGEHTGQFRTQSMEYLAGEKKTTAIVKENNTRLTVDVENVYFSIRLSTERKRIAEQVRPGERILCMFSGAGPYPIVFAKNTQAKHITAIEINPKGHELAQLNAQLNKVQDKIAFYCGDVRQVIPEKIVPETFDRITMPLPKTAEEFLPVALRCAHQGTIVHYYAFLHEDEFDTAKEQVQQACADAKLGCEIQDIVKCGQHAPRVWRICVDFMIL